MATNASCPACAESIAARQVISTSAPGGSSRAPSWLAISWSFMNTNPEDARSVIVNGCQELSKSLRLNKEFGLPRFVYRLAARLLAPNHGQDPQLFQRRPGHKHPLDVSSRVRRRNQVSLRDDLGQVIGHHAFP